MVPTVCGHFREGKQKQRRTVRHVASKREYLSAGRRIDILSMGGEACVCVRACMLVCCVLVDYARDFFVFS